MAKKDSKDLGLSVAEEAFVAGAEVSLPEGASQPVVSIEHPSNKEDEDVAGWAAGQDAALNEYRLTGINRGYLDPSRDQEPDIAPEFGVSPHPELFNPAPPKGALNAHPAKSDVVASFEEKEEAAAEAEEAVEESAEAEAEGLSKEEALSGNLVEDESPKSASKAGR